MIDQTKKRYRFRIVIPAFPAVNIYSIAARRTTALPAPALTAAKMRSDTMGVSDPGMAAAPCCLSRGWTAAGLPASCIPAHHR